VTRDRHLLNPDRGGLFGGEFGGSLTPRFIRKNTQKKDVIFTDVDNNKKPYIEINGATKTGYFCQLHP
jgi:hypothetical protein